MVLFLTFEVEKFKSFEKALPKARLLYSKAIRVLTRGQIGCINILCYDFSGRNAR
jgi:hypothetical protein